MKNKKKNIIIISILLVIVLGIILFIAINSDSTRLTTEEKSWISNNQKKVQNINVLNDTNIFGNLGKGIYYSFLKDMSEEYGIILNNITIKKEETSNGIGLLVGNYLRDGSLSFYEDHYVLVTKTKEMIPSFSKITNKKIGVLASSEEYIKKYMADSSNTFSVYDNIEELLKKLDAGEIGATILPRIEYMDEVLKKNYWISYHFSDLKRYFYIEDETNSTLFQIIKKYYKKWFSKNLINNLYEEERNIFKDSLKISDADLKEIQKETLYFGYKTHAPYEVYGDRTYGGIVAKYINAFEHFAGLDIKYEKYNNNKKLLKDINNNKIKLYFAYNIVSNTGSTIETNIPQYMSIYIHEKNNTVINTLESLKGKKIYVEKDSFLYQNLLTIEGLTIETYEKLDTVLKNKDNILAIDKNVGKYLETSTLKTYTSRFEIEMPSNYNIKSFGNDTLNILLTKYINYLDNNKIKEEGIYDARNIESKGTILNSLAKYALYAVVLVIIILLLIYRSSKRVRMQKKIKKEDKLKFIDHLTSLKNRNYLNENLTNWNKNTIYPQSVIMMDLNKVQEINDTLGYEEGDRQIKSVANSLIKMQLDNTDIIRTNGNEFMIYLVGYNQKQITSYIHKLNKEFKNLPFNYGVCITYSMIQDDLKLIEDAINECVEDIKKQKENQKEEEK